MFLCYKYDKISAVPQPVKVSSGGSLKVFHLKSVPYLTSSLNIIESGTGMWTTVGMTVFLGGKKPHMYGDAGQEWWDESLTSPSPWETDLFFLLFAWTFWLTLHRAKIILLCLMRNKKDCLLLQKSLNLLQMSQSDLSIPPTGSCSYDSERSLARSSSSLPVMQIGQSEADIRSAGSYMGESNTTGKR